MDQSTAGSLVARRCKLCLWLLRAPLLADKNHAQMEHYIIPAESNIVMCDYQHVHPVLVVPVEYFEKKRSKARQINLDMAPMFISSAHVVYTQVISLHPQRDTWRLKRKGTTTPGSSTFPATLLT